MAHAIDMTGQKVGDWTVVSESPIKSRRGTSWECICKCGVRALIDGTNLRAGRSKCCLDCSYIAYEDPKTKPGAKIGEWEVIGRDKQRRGRSICRCSCGTIKSIIRASLRKGESQKCVSCARKKLNHTAMIGRRFYKWTVIGLEKSKYQNKTVYKCQCVCGTTRIIDRDTLTNLKSSQCRTCALKSR